MGRVSEVHQYRADDLGPRRNLDSERECLLVEDVGLAVEKLAWEPRERRERSTYGEARVGGASLGDVRRWRS